MENITHASSLCVLLVCNLSSPGFFKYCNSASARGPCVRTSLRRSSAIAFPSSFELRAGFNCMELELFPPHIVLSLCGYLCWYGFASPAEPSLPALTLVLGSVSQVFSWISRPSPAYAFPLCASIFVSQLAIPTLHVYIEMACDI